MFIVFSISVVPYTYIFLLAYIFVYFVLYLCSFGSLFVYLFCALEGYVLDRQIVSSVVSSFVR